MLEGCSKKGRMMEGVWYRGTAPSAAADPLSETAKDPS